jgi:hypothetical protein
MDLFSRRVRVQIASVPLLRLAHITTSQELRSARAQGNCQGINFLIPKASQTKKRRNKGVKGPRSRPPLTLQRLPHHPDNLQIFAWAQHTHKCSHTRPLYCTWCGHVDNDGSAVTSSRGDLCLAALCARSLKHAHFCSSLACCGKT